MHDSRNIPLVLGLWLVGIQLCSAQQQDASGYRRSDSVQVLGNADLLYHKNSLLDETLHIIEPYPIWMRRILDHNGSRIRENVGYDPVLYSYQLVLIGEDFPDFVEFQVQDSIYQLILFHKGTTTPSSVGRIKKYFGQYDGLACSDQEDTTFTAHERQCVFELGEMASMHISAEPCSAPVGEWLHYWPNGVLRSRGHYFQKDFYSMYSESTEEGGVTFTRDTKVKTGRWDYFDESGQLIRTVHYVPIWLNSPNSR
jgi:hypothetical protein